MNNIIAALLVALIVSPMAAWAADGPTRGMSKAQVRQQFGEPQRVRTPVGNPPIGRWHYPDFTVYFENDIVLHSVSEERPARTDETTTVRERETGHPLPPDVENEETQIEVESRIKNRDADSDDERDKKRDDDETDESDIAPGSTGVRAAGSEQEEEAERDLDADPQDQDTATDPDKAADRFRFDPASGRIVIEDEDDNEG
ncbi:hypothetical protein ACLD02_14405 [Alloalcanivorax sp. C16-2]|uniref:hypothetical protein n=1 Tax=Alloalcanivorax TaxID=3020832 RepID=UPI0019344243|nr:hypothetical protein [Alloalcanivorax marinus]MBL7249048.1 hypothetical protein [Alloalcanivorax marinus]